VQLLHRELLRMLPRLVDQSVSSRPHFGALRWAVLVAAVCTGLIIVRMETAPAVVAFALALLAGVAKSGTS
jgi:hypothetical protein